MKTLLSLIVFALALNTWGFDVPALKAPVNDYANIIDARTEAQLNTLLKKLKDQTGTQLAVLTVNSLGGESIEAASIQVTDKWQLGSKEEDNGVLLFIAKDDRKLRVEVGQGHEGNLTDLHSKRIIDYVITPEFKKGNFPQGIVSGVVAIVSYTNPNFIKQMGQNPNEYRSKTKPKKEGGSLISLLIRLIILAIIVSRFGIFSLFLPGIGRSGRGGFGGGGFGGGGFGGGGGGFSGGGSSGSW